MQPQYQYMQPVPTSVPVSMGAPVEAKDGLIASLRAEAMELRAREREYKMLQDQLLSLEQSFNRCTDEKRRMEDDYKSRIEVNINMISASRNDIDDQKALLIDRKKQNADLYTEFDTQKDILNSRHSEIARLRSDNA